MEYLLEIVREGLAEIKSVVEQTPDLGDWNVDLYYEAMGLDFEPTNENDDQ